MEDSKIVHAVGEIFQKDRDNPNFKICGPQKEILQYYAFHEKPIVEEKGHLETVFKKQYRPILSESQTGLIRIRFAVNCAGLAGRFRVMGMDNHYQPKEFSKEVTEQLRKITKAYNGWRIMRANGKARDYYMYLVFKMEKGELIEIMP